MSKAEAEKKENVGGKAGVHSRAGIKKLLPAAPAKARPFAFHAELAFEDFHAPQRMEQAIAPELNNVFERRGKTSIKANKNLLVMEIHAEDATALRASINAYLKLIWLAMKIQRLTQG